MTQIEKNIVDNLRCHLDPAVRQAVENAHITDEQLLATYRDFSLSEDFGRNDEKFPSWL